MLEPIKKEELINLLKGLASKINEEIEEGISNKSIEPEEMEYMQYKVTKFKYTDKGVTEHGGGTQPPITKKTWDRAIYKITDSIKKLDEYKSILNKGFDIEERYLDSFVRRMINDKIENINVGEDELNKIITLFIDDLNGEPLKCGAEIKLQGLVLLQEEINFKISDTSINLRQTKAVDLEKDIPQYDFMQNYFQPAPSAILTMEFFGREPLEIQHKVEQAISILRLFRVGSIKYISYHMHSESFMRFGFGTVTPSNTLSASENCIIKGEDAQKLKNFWEIMRNYTAIIFDEIANTNTHHINIAYKRYCEALMEGGLIERRTASAVMGFESLFLEEKKNEEITYRLKMRISKLLTKFEFNPSKIKKVITDAYRIRSRYVHGGVLTHEYRKKFENEYGSVNKLFQLIIEYLRISILIMIFIKKEKAEFLDLIDDSLIDKVKDSEIENLLNNVKNLIPLKTSDSEA